MNSKKKLFEAEDFDKKKKLFTSSDFDKESEVNIPVEYPKAEKNRDTEVSHENGNSNSKYWRWILLGVIALCVIGYFIFTRSGDTSATESEQDTELVEETILSTDSVGNQEEPTEEVLSTQENEVSNIADDQKAKVNETPVATENNSNDATSTSRVAGKANVSSDVETEAMKVIRGDYGVGQERKDKLGTKYHEHTRNTNRSGRESAFCRHWP